MVSMAINRNTCSIIATVVCSTRADSCTSTSTSCFDYSGTSGDPALDMAMVSFLKLRLTFKPLLGRRRTCIDTWDRTQGQAAVHYSAWPWDSWVPTAAHASVSRPEGGTCLGFHAIVASYC